MYTVQVTTDLLNLVKFLKLRLAPDAQYETRIVALAMYDAVAALAAVTFDVWGVKELAEKTRALHDSFDR